MFHILLRAQTASSLYQLWNQLRFSDEAVYGWVQVFYF